MGRYIVILFMLVPCSICSVMAQGIPEDNDSLRILCIGNSFSDDAVNQNLVELASARGITLYIGNLYIGGCSLENHVSHMRRNKSNYAYRRISSEGFTSTNHVSILEALQDTTWDIVTLQQASPLSGRWETYEPYLSELVDSVRQHTREDIRIYWYMTWAYASSSLHPGFEYYHYNQWEMYDSIAVCVDSVMARGIFHGYIPCGTAIQYARLSYLGDTFCRDGYHMKIPYGQYCLACTWLEAITGHSIIGCPYKPGGMSPEQQSVAQRAAHKACQFPYMHSVP